MKGEGGFSIDPVIWKDIQVLKGKRSNIIFVLLLGIIIAIGLNIIASHANSSDLANLFNSNFLYLSIFLPIFAAYSMTEIVYTVEINEYSIESILATSLSVRRLLINKTFLAAATSWLIELSAMIIAMVGSWFFIYHMILIPPLSILVNLFVSFWLTLGICGLIGVGYWIYPKTITIAALSIVILVPGAIGVYVAPVTVPYNLLFTLFFFIVALIVNVLFYQLIGLVNKERVALAKQ